MYKKEEKLDKFDAEYPVTVKGKSEVTSKFSVQQLEELLYNGTKNVA